MLREIFGKKLGMTQVFDGTGNLVAVTLVDIEPVRVLETVEYPKKKVARVGCFGMFQMGREKAQQSL
jgi:ribosomal protein L3